MGFEFFEERIKKILSGENFPSYTLKQNTQIFTEGGRLAQIGGITLTFHIKYNAKPLKYGLFKWHQASPFQALAAQEVDGAPPNHHLHRK